MIVYGRYEMQLRYVMHQSETDHDVIFRKVLYETRSSLVGTVGFKTTRLCVDVFQIRLAI